MTSFPVDAFIFNKIVEVFNQTRQYVLLLFPLAFFIRIAFGFIYLKSESFIDILKDSLFLFLGLFFFTDILKLTLQIPYFVANELSTTDFKNINLGSGIFTKALKRIVDWIGIVAYWVSFGLYVVIVSILGFFSAYILFFGTMFRLYGLLKIFFILLFTVSLWPLLWHSINFAVLTIAVSNNAFANNIIVGGSSLAKVFIPIWLLSKASKIPLSNQLKKVSLTGGSLAMAGGNYASSFLNNTNLSQSLRNNQEGNQETNKLSELSFSKLEDKQNFTKDEDYLNNPPADFSLTTDNNSLEFENSNHKELSFEENNNLFNENVLNETNTLKEQSMSQESAQSENHVSNSKALNETKNSQSVSNESLSNERLLNENPLNETKPLDSELSNKSQNPKSESFNERANESWEEERDNPNRLLTEEEQEEDNNKGAFER